MKKLFLGLFLLLITSCSLDNIDGLMKLSKNCLCNVNANLDAITNKEKGAIKEFSFINSDLFELGISKDNFALSAAILINNYFEIESGQIIKVNIVEDRSVMNKETTTYTYQQCEIEELSPKYFEIETMINVFVQNIYQENFYKCKMLTDIPVKTEEFNLLMAKIFGSFEKGYIDTKILSYKVEKKAYQIYGGIYTENDMIKLFDMAFKETYNGLKIIAFEFY
ncbi:MAG TPA: hypothetical protein VK982_01190 [Bacteroidales bacterium]|nr:hypothetical protein [Bacteroidales bacterium]